MPLRHNINKAGLIRPGFFYDKLFYELHFVRNEKANIFVYATFG